MKYKVGDNVRVRSDLGEHQIYGGVGIGGEMPSFRGKIVQISKIIGKTYKIREDGCKFYWTDEMFEPVEDEMTAEEAIKWLADMCCTFDCNSCPLSYVKEFSECFEYGREHPEKVLEALKKYKADCEKKPFEFEFVNVIRVIEDTGTSKKCVYEERFPDGEAEISEKQSEILKKYCEKHKGRYFTVVERICVVKG